MSRGKQGLFTFVAALATVATMAVAPAWAADSDPASGSDEKIPEPVTNLLALPATGSAGIELTWDLSASDFVRQSPVGSDFTSGGSFSNVNDVAGYEIARNGAVIDTAAAGDSAYIDELAPGGSISYEVTAFDAAGNRSAAVEAFASVGPPPQVSLDSAPIAFGAGFGLPASGGTESASVVLEISNLATETGALLIANSSVEGGNGFSVSPASLQIQPNGTGTVTVTFSSPDVGDLNGLYNDILTIHTNDANNPRYAISLSAEVDLGLKVQHILVAPRALAFSTRRLVNTTGVKQLTLANTGGKVLNGSFVVNGDAFSTGASLNIARPPGTGRQIFITFTPTTAGVHRGTVVFTTDDPNTPTLTIPLSGGAVDELPVAGTVRTRVIKARIVFSDNSILDVTDEIAVEAFKTDFRAALAQKLGIDPSRIKNIAITQGSIIVNFDIAQTKVDTTEPTAQEALDDLLVSLADTTESNAITDIGAVSSASDQSQNVVLQPLDDGGEPILGWFAVGEDQVGLASFFLFSEQYGTSVATGGYDELYDIAPLDPDGVIDLTDFFVFADNYGKVVANVDEIRDALQ